MFTLSSSGLVPPLAGTKSSVPAGPRGPIGPARRSQTAEPHAAAGPDIKEQRRSRAREERRRTTERAGEERASPPPHAAYRHTAHVSTSDAFDKLSVRQAWRYRPSPFFILIFFTGTRGVASPPQHAFQAGFRNFRNACVLQYAFVEHNEEGGKEKTTKKKKNCRSIAPC